MMKSVGLYGITILPVFLILLIKYFHPTLLGNEAGKLISPRQVIDPSFLSNDWAVARGLGDNVFDLIFALLIAPFWLCLRKAILVALAARLLCWGILLVAIVRLFRALSIEWYALSCGLVVWACHRQTLGAQEWLLSGAEAKCLAYAMLMLALDAALRKRLWRAGLCCGLAVCCHVLVGAWGSLALGCALLICHRDYGWRRVAQFALLVAGASMPVVLIAVRYAGPGTPADRHASDRLAVTFSDPFHLDPSYFGGWHEFAVALVLTVVAAWLFFKIATRPQAKLLSAFLVLLLLEFLAGLSAWELNQSWFLKSFPFRVPDVLILLFFMLALTCFVARKMVSLGKQLRELDPKARPASEWRSQVLFFIGACWVLAAFAAGPGYVFKKDLPVCVAAWRQYINAPETSWQEMTGWIRDHTPKSAIILAPPWEFTFWLDAERAQVVSYKRPPHNAGLVEWYRRMTAVNGGAFQTRGTMVKAELLNNYPKLSLAQLEAVHQLDGADYYLTTQERGDLSANLIHVSGAYYLYQLRSLDPPVAPR
ncbi:MAG: DUF6798 domain-containing protein [Terracidiphilus sp.]